MQIAILPATTWLERRPRPRWPRKNKPAPGGFQRILEAEIRKGDKIVNLEQRVIVLEKEIADLKRQLEERPKKHLCKCGRLEHYSYAKFCVDCGLPL